MNYNLGEVLKRFTLQKTTYYDNLIILYYILAKLKLDKALDMIHPVHQYILVH